MNSSIPPSSADANKAHPFLDKPGEKISGLFDEIAPRYDLLNRVLSFNIDVWWRHQAVKSLQLKPGHKVLDACCGTGDLSMAALAAEPNLDVIGSDFSIQMLLTGDRKRRQKAGHFKGPQLVHADTLDLPFPDNTFDGAMVGFGMRNVANLPAGLRELSRVLKPGGRLMVLEFTPMTHRWLRPFSDWYQGKVLPGIGNLLSGSKVKAYSYLDESVKDWPDGDRFAEVIRRTPLHAVKWRPLFPGNVAVHEAVKA
ncbi:MAG: ubiquinone/menaquinone biosynthesis methyltransferase [Planctomycetia bacterium]|jgi:demethylmenaquinone methyltransferase/2-methoxy-6-polyprenyl-1,4-benzoquinol methylase|nr:ubiquinone/menaquinone biosynthesis methyltransferase [Planctomycetia bacterium]NCG12430.1 ubiquinone/menaquinone biosynthesis methyltransferase [Planctomycetia bacterium]